MQENLRLLTGLQAQYDALESYDDCALYFITDTHRIYKGSALFASGYIENMVQVEDIELYGGSATDIVEGGE